MSVSLAANRESLPLLSSPATKINRRLSSHWYKKGEHSEHSFIAKKESPFRNSARTEEREGRCLRSPCHSRPYTGDQQFGFWGAFTRLPNSIVVVHLLLGGLLVLPVAAFSFPVIGSSSLPSSLLHGDRGRTRFWKSECGSPRV